MKNLKAVSLETWRLLLVYVLVLGFEQFVQSSQVLPTYQEPIRTHVSTKNSKLGKHISMIHCFGSQKTSIMFDQTGKYAIYTKDGTEDQLNLHPTIKGVNYVISDPTSTSYRLIPSALLEFGSKILLLGKNTANTNFHLVSKDLSDFLDPTEDSSSTFIATVITSTTLIEPVSISNNLVLLGPTLQVIRVSDGQFYSTMGFPLEADIIRRQSSSIDHPDPIPFLLGRNANSDQGILSSKFWSCTLTVNTGTSVTITQLFEADLHAASKIILLEYMPNFSTIVTCVDNMCYSFDYSGNPGLQFSPMQGYSSDLKATLGSYMNDGLSKSAETLTFTAGKSLSTFSFVPNSPAFSSNVHLNYLAYPNLWIKFTQIASCNNDLDIIACDDHNLYLFTREINKPALYKRCSQEYQTKTTDIAPFYTCVPCFARQDYLANMNDCTTRMNHQTFLDWRFQIHKYSPSTRKLIIRFKSSDPSFDSNNIIHLYDYKGWPYRFSLWANGTKLIYTNTGTSWLEVNDIEFTMPTSLLMEPERKLWLRVTSTQTLRENENSFSQSPNFITQMNSATPSFFVASKEGNIFVKKEINCHFDIPNSADLTPIVYTEAVPPTTFYNGPILPAPPTDPLPLPPFPPTEKPVNNTEPKKPSQEKPPKDQAPKPTLKPPSRLKGFLKGMHSILISLATIGFITTSFSVNFGPAFVKCFQILEILGKFIFAPVRYLTTTEIFLKSLNSLSDLVELSPNAIVPKPKSLPTDYHYKMSLYEQPYLILRAFPGFVLLFFIGQTVKFFLKFLDWVIVCWSERKRKRRALQVYPKQEPNIPESANSSFVSFSISEKQSSKSPPTLSVNMQIKGERYRAKDLRMAHSVKADCITRPKSPNKQSPKSPSKQSPKSPSRLSKTPNQPQTVYQEIPPSKGVQKARKVLRLLLRSLERQIYYILEMNMVEFSFHGAHSLLFPEKTFVYPKHLILNQILGGALVIACVWHLCALSIEFFKIMNQKKSFRKRYFPINRQSLGKSLPEETELEKNKPEQAPGKILSVTSDASPSIYRRILTESLSSTPPDLNFQERVKEKQPFENTPKELGPSSIGLVYILLSNYRLVLTELILASCQHIHWLGITSISVIILLPAITQFYIIFSRLKYTCLLSKKNHSCFKTKTVTHQTNSSTDKRKIFKPQKMENRPQKKKVQGSTLAGSPDTDSKVDSCSSFKKPIFKTCLQSAQYFLLEMAYLAYFLIMLISKASYSTGSREVTIEEESENISHSGSSFVQFKTLEVLGHILMGFTVSAILFQILLIGQIIFLTLLNCKKKKRQIKQANKSLKDPQDKKTLTSKAKQKINICENKISIKKLLKLRNAGGEKVSLPKGLLSKNRKLKRNGLKQSLREKNLGRSPQTNTSLSTRGQITPPAGGLKNGLSKSIMSDSKRDIFKNTKKSSPSFLTPTSKRFLSSTDRDHLPNNLTLSNSNNWNKRVANSKNSPSTNHSRKPSDKVCRQKPKPSFSDAASPFLHFSNPNHPKPGLTIVKNACPKEC